MVGLSAKLQGSHHEKSNGQRYSEQECARYKPHPASTFWYKHRLLFGIVRHARTSGIGAIRSSESKEPPTGDGPVRALVVPTGHAPHCKC